MADREEGSGPPVGVEIFYETTFVSIDYLEEKYAKSICDFFISKSVKERDSGNNEFDKLTFNFVLIAEVAVAYLIIGFLISRL